MNARLYDPVLGRMLSADNFTGSGTQGFNRYSYANNNPLNSIDPDGNWVHIVIGAAIGGLVNGFLHIDQPGGFWKGFAIGAVAGAVTAATGGLAAGYAATGTAAGAWAGATTGAFSSGVIGGAISGSTGAILGSPLLGWGNQLAFKEPYTGKQFIRDVIGGGVLGGVAGGISARIQGNNIWNNAPKATGTNWLTDPAKNNRLLFQQEWARKLNGKWAHGRVIPQIAQGVFPDGKTISYGFAEADQIALGFNFGDNLSNFAAKVGGQPFGKWADPKLAIDGGFFELDFLRKINNSNTLIHFDLTLPDGSMMNPWSSMNKIMANGGNMLPNNVTNWELYQIFTNPAALDRTLFYYRGLIIR